MEQTIYCISGLGADEQIFTKLKLQGYTLKHIPWLEPMKGETMEEYAVRMGSLIKEENAVLIGVSFGGMMAIEIAKQKHLKKLILVSSIKSTAELPYWMKVAGKLKLDKVLPLRPIKLTEKIADYRLGVSNEEEKQMAKGYRKAANMVYLEWAVNQAINWKNSWQPDHIVHIHGDKDRIFPVRRIASAIVIKEGTHMMIYNRADEISNIILKELTAA
jgi:pimeloyl-ACP methyl ester carboxylesterase